MIPPRDASAALAPELCAGERPAPSAEPEAPARLPAALAEELDAAAESEPGRVRILAVQSLSAFRQRQAAAIRDAFERSPSDSERATRGYRELTDALVAGALYVATRHLHPLSTPTATERIALLAIGGYGRGTMAPFSDVDLLFLSPWKITPWAESVIESVLYILWDVKLKVGHATRTVRDCLRLGRTDMTIRTSLLEHRLLAGDPSLAADLSDRLWSDLFHGSAAEFIEAKLAERNARHERQGGQRYVLEPNVKEGKGGLRDLHSLYWIAKHAHRVQTVAELHTLGLFSAEESAAFDAAERFLLAVRCHLHLIAGRATDQLSFDMQVAVAARMGYADRGGRRAVEHFMQDYFLHATRVGELTRIFLTALEAGHVKRAPRLARLFRRKPRLAPGYRIKGNRLTVADAAAFLADKINLLRLFEQAMTSGLFIHPDAMRLVAANLHCVDDAMRRDAEAARLFLSLLLDHGNPERALRRMNELGLLAAFLPEFAPIVAMMQFNFYHRYTVDEHTIQTISALARIERGELAEELPVASAIMRGGVNRRVLYVALLMHDIGKGRPEAHDELGARIAAAVCPRLGLDESETATVEWLVRHHLLMSDMAQKRDISDPRTVRDFAEAVGTRGRLDLLTVLTVCDIRGVGPGVWNNWKAMLLHDLYRETAEVLDTGRAESDRATRAEEGRSALRARLTDWTTAALERESVRHYGPYWQELDTDTHAVFAGLLRDIPDDEVRMDLHPDPGRDATRAAFALADHPGIFARLAGALALVGANVVDARTYTTSDGFATAVFWIQDGDGAPYEGERLEKLTPMIERTLKGKVVTRDALADRDRLKKREKSFRFPTSVTFDNEGSDIYTIVEVDTRDRPGLLYDLARTLSGAHVQIASAVIATYGAQAVDSFYVKDMFGLKLHSEGRRATLRKKLEQAVAEGAERAGR